jgi:YVTN family beta-propeller protein
VADKDGNAISVLDTGSRSLSATIATGVAPQGLAASPDGKLLYTANSGSNDLGIIDIGARKLIGTIAVGRQPSGVAWNKTQTLLLVTGVGDDSLSFVDPSNSSVKQTIKMGKEPAAVAVAYAEPQPGQTATGQTGVTVGPGGTTVVTALPKTGGGGSQDWG